MSSFRVEHCALLASFASIGAGVVHFFAAGLYIENPFLAQIMLVLAAAQCGGGVLTLLHRGRVPTLAVTLTNVIAVSAWVTTRVTAVRSIDGLELAEPPGLSDTAAAVLAVVAVLAGSIALRAPSGETSAPRALLAPAVVASLVIAGVAGGFSHEHDEPLDSGHQSAGHDQLRHNGVDHDHVDSGAGPSVTGTDHTVHVDWPRPWDPAQPIDLSGVPGVTTDQQARATALIRNTLDKLPTFADVSSIGALGYKSIGDAFTGYEHFINYDYIRAERILDATHPESLVYQVNGPTRTLVSAMYIAGGKSLDDRELTEFAGPLMQWHVHSDVCWGGDPHSPRVLGVTDNEGHCPAGSSNTEMMFPMVHVWIVPNRCGPFAALAGHGAGQVASSTEQRADTCPDDHSTGHR